MKAETTPPIFTTEYLQEKLRDYISRNKILLPNSKPNFSKLESILGVNHNTLRQIVNGTSNGVRWKTWNKLKEHLNFEVQAVDQREAA